MSNAVKVLNQFQYDSKQKEVWLKSKEAIELLEIKKPLFHYYRERGKFICREIYDNGGKQYEVLLSSLGMETEAKYYKKHIQPKVELKEELTPEEKIEIDNELYAKMPRWQREFVDKYLPVIRAAEGLKGKALKEMLKQFSGDSAKGLSYGNFMKIKKRYDEKGISGLVPGYGKNAGDSKVNDDDFEYFKSLYLKEGCPTLESCWLGVKGYAVKKNGGVVDDDYPSAITFLRRLEREIPEPAIYLARYGQAAYNKKYAAYIDRDFSDIKAGEVWVSDHRQLDQAVLIHLPDDPKKDIKLFLKYFERDNRKTSRPVFPWVTAWRCFKTGKWMGWHIHVEDPNADHIFQAFYNAAAKYGIPTDIIIDNGKDYRCRDFAGGRRFVKVNVDEHKTRSLVSMLQIQPWFSLPYNAQTKPIERDFKIWKDWKDRQMPGYRGGNIVERPEKLLNEIKQNKIVDFEEFVELSEYFIENILHKYSSDGKNLLGKSRDEAFGNEFEGLKRVTNDALKMFCMRTSGDLSIRRNGIVLNQKYNLYYWAEWMTGLKGRKVYLRRDINKYEEAWVFDAVNDEYLGKAILNAWQAPALAKDEISRRQVQEVIAAKKRELKIMKSYIETNEIQPAEVLENMALGIAASTNYVEAAKEIKHTNIIKNTPMDEALSKEELFKKTGTYDLPYKPKRPGKKFYLYESDKEESEINSG